MKQKHIKINQSMYAENFRTQVINKLSFFTFNFWQVYAYEKYNETFTTSLVRKDEDLEVIGVSKKDSQQSNSHQTQLMQLPNQPTYFNQQDGNQSALPPTQPSPVQQGQFVVDLLALKTQVRNCYFLKSCYKGNQVVLKLVRISQWLRMLWIKK